MATTPEYSYRPASTLALLVSLLIVAGAVASAIAALCTAMQVQLLESVRYGGTLSPAQAEAYDTRQRVLAAVEVGLAVPTLVLFLAWVYRCNRNARALGAAWLEFSPGWSVGCFFVPILNFYAPYQAVREVWRASLPGPGGQPRARASPLLGTWWAAWLAVAFIQWSRLGALFGRRDLTRLVELRSREAGGDQLSTGWLEQLLQFSWGILLTDVVAVAASLLAVAVIITITNLQERKQTEASRTISPEAVAAPQRASEQ